MLREEIEAKEALEKLKGDTNYLKTGMISGKSKEELEKEYKEYKDSLIKAKKLKLFMSTTFFGFFFIILIAIALVFGYQTYFRDLKNKYDIDKKSPYYINNIYFADTFLSEKHLTVDEREEYKRWLKSLKEYKKSYIVNFKNFQSKSLTDITASIKKIYRIMKLEHPELFYFDTYVMESSNGIHSIEIFNYYNTKFNLLKDLKTFKLERKVDDFLSTVKSTSDYNKIKQVYDYLANKKLEIGVLNENQNFSTAMISSKTSCESIAKAAQILLKRVNINSRLVSGTLYEQPRYYNIVKLSDGYYIFDACVGAEIKATNNQEDYQKGMLAFNTSDYQTDLVNIKEEGMGNLYKYRKTNE